ncbi:MAG: tetratricopeptide repeat protein, partial [Planctomycetota bacterium]|nr:tetratricopeptide repeat protein [Planctomycetota bacterium]
LIVKTLETRKRALGDEHPNTLVSMFNLALLYVDQGRYDEAEPLFVKSLETEKRNLGDEHRDTLSIMNDLAYLYMNLGRYDEAEPLYIETMEIRKRVMGDEHRDTLGSITNLGYLYLSMNRFDDARAMFERSLPIKRRVLGLDDPWTRTALWGLARAYDGLEQFDDALPLWRELQEFQLAQVEDPGASAQVLNAAAWDLLTNEHAELRDPARALPLAQRAVDKVRGDDPAILDTLALAQFMSGNTAAAIETEKKALSLLPPEAPGRDEYEAALARFETALKDDETEHESDADKDN